MGPKVANTIRILLAVFMLIFGLDKFLHFVPIPPVEGVGGELMSIYAESGFLYLIGTLQIISGIALLIKKYVPLALIVIVAIMFNALVFHILHDLAGIGGSAVGLILGLVCIYNNKARFSSLLSA